MVEIIRVEIMQTGHITNCYIYSNDNKEAILIDAPDKADIILDKLKEKGLNLKYILLTHTHADHTMALNKLMENTDAKVVVNEHEKDTLIGKVRDYSENFGTEQYAKDVSKMIFVKDQDVIELGEIKIQAIWTPGHTKGSTSYYIEKDNILFTGDTLFSNCVGRWDLETASVTDTVDSIAKLYRLFKAQNTIIYPGHNETGIHIKETFFPVSRVIFNNTGVDLSIL